MKQLGLMFMFILIGFGICTMLSNAKINLRYDNTELSLPDINIVRQTNFVMVTNTVFETNQVMMFVPFQTNELETNDTVSHLNRHEL